MVNINLYRNKKEKFKLTTIIVFIAILLLPVIALRFTIETIKTLNVSEIMSRYQYSGRYIDTGNIAASINELDQQDAAIRSRTINIANETRRIEADIIYANLTSDFIREVGYQYNRFADTEKIFIDQMSIKRGSDFRINYYDVSQNLLGVHNFSRELKSAYNRYGLSIGEENVVIDFMFVDILQEQLTAKTSSF